MSKVSHANATGCLMHLMDDSQGLEFIYFDSPPVNVTKVFEECTLTGYALNLL